MAVDICHFAGYPSQGCSSLIRLHSARITINTGMNKDYTFIDSQPELVNFCTQIAGEPYCAIDTEFVREKTYYPVLALIQIASQHYQACIDPLKITDWQPFRELLANQQVVKVFHSSSQDLEIILQELHMLPLPVFDTQVAAAVMGYSHQIGYGELVNQITGVQLEKKYARTDWCRRPLSDGELDYAMDDVRYLMPVYEKLRQDLEASGRMDWITAELEAMSQPDNYRVDMSTLWQKLKGVQKLKGAKLQVASALSQWRENTAQQKNRPRRWIIKDEVLVDIARRMPESLGALESIRDLSSEMVKRHGAGWLTLVQEAKKMDPAMWPELNKSQPLTVDQQALGDCLMAICRQIANDNNIALATLVTRKDIDRLLLGKTNGALTQGWRMAMVGETLLAFLHGQLNLVADGKRLRLLHQDT